MLNTIFISVCYLSYLTAVNNNILIYFIHQGLTERLRMMFTKKQELFVLRVWSCFITILDKVSLYLYVPEKKQQLERFIYIKDLTLLLTALDFYNLLSPMSDFLKKMTL